MFISQVYREVCVTVYAPIFLVVYCSAVFESTIRADYVRYEVFMPVHFVNYLSCLPRQFLGNLLGIDLRGYSLDLYVTQSTQSANS